MVRIGYHFEALIPSRRIINPITRSNWEGTGVIPDIAVAPDKALEAAQAMMQRRLQSALNPRPVAAQ